MQVQLVRLGDEVDTRPAACRNLPGVVLVRDTKDREGGTLDFTPGTRRSFVILAKQLGPIG